MKPRPEFLLERVRVVNPRVFKRVGYPFDREHAYNALGGDSLYKKVRDFMHSVGFRRDFDTLHLNRLERHKDKRDLLKTSRDPEDLIVQALCSQWLQENGFGGNERKVYYTEGFVNVGDTGVVVEQRRVQEGYRHEGFSGYSYDGDYDSQPPSLEVSRVITLLRISLDKGSTVEMNRDDIEVVKTTEED